VILSRCHLASWPEARYASHARTAHNGSTGVKMLKSSLYERLGGTDGIKAVAQAFEQRAGKDDRINQKFARTNFERLTKEFVDQLCQDAGGPCSYTGLSMKQSHTNMGVTSGEFDAFVEDFVATLNDFNVGKAEQDELLSDLAPMRDDIVEVDSPETGTPLPAAFTPAPPL
jgi:hemoglobin